MIDWAAYREHTQINLSLNLLYQFEQSKQFWILILHSQKTHCEAGRGQLSLKKSFEEPKSFIRQRERAPVNFGKREKLIL